MFLGWRTHINVPPQLHPKAGFVNPETPLDVRLGTAVFQKMNPNLKRQGHAIVRNPLPKISGGYRPFPVILFYFFHVRVCLRDTCIKTYVYLF